MSQEQPPVRSRREMRQARDERPEAGQQTAPGAPGAADPASKPASPGAADTPASPGAADTPTAANVPGRSRRVADGPVDSVRPAAGTPRSSQIRARDRAALRNIKELAEKENHLSAGGPPTRRQLRLMQLAAETAPATEADLAVAAAPGTGAIAEPGASRAGDPHPLGMTVEQALAARELLAGEAHRQLAKMDDPDARDPDAVDPGALAEQIALAERAAVLNRRAAARQRLAEQNSQPSARQPRNDRPAEGDRKMPPALNDPAAASNLAMVTPLEFEQVPGVERPVMKRPATSHVPVATNPGPRVEAPRKSGSRRPGSPQQDPAVPAEPAGESAGRTPVAARAAYGLDPLDAATAGLGRAQRLRMLQLGVLALGLLALIAGITLIVTGFTR